MFQVDLEILEDQMVLEYLEYLEILVLDLEVIISTLHRSTAIVWHQ
jgi:hypothetical protein